MADEPGEARETQHGTDGEGSPVHRRRGSRRAATAVAAAVVVAAAATLVALDWLGGDAGDTPTGDASRVGAGVALPGTPPPLGAGGGFATGSPPPGLDNGSGPTVDPRAAGTPTAAGGGRSASASAGGGGARTPLVPTVAPGTGPVFTAVAGPGCPREGGRDAQVSRGWQRAGGGWTSDGCDGSSWSRLTDPVGGESVSWLFMLPSVGSCAVEVYVSPEGGTPSAFYDMVSGTAVSSFTVDQGRHHGGWVAAGRFPVSAGALRIRLTDRGDGRSRVAAAATRLTCQ